MERTNWNVFVGSLSGTFNPRMWGNGGIHDCSTLWIYEQNTSCPKTPPVMSFIKCRIVLQFRFSDQSCMIFNTKVFSQDQSEEWTCYEGNNMISVLKEGGVLAHFADCPNQLSWSNILSLKCLFWNIHNKNALNWVCRGKCCFLAVHNSSIGDLVTTMR